MADVIRKSTNKFTKGLVMDFSPENTQNEVLTHALNATLLTFNGNEMSLQNDMGNARVETAYLPEGYMPVGTCEYGGVIYIVSYNPLEDKSQIGCFPSPERNISRKELGEAENVSITADKFHDSKTGLINNTTQYVLLKNDKLNPGDKFLICANNTIYDERLENLLVHKDLAEDQIPSEFEPVEHPVLALNVVSIEDSGKVIYLNNDIRDYTYTNTYTDENNIRHTDGYKYHIVGNKAASGDTFNQEAVDPDAYRDVLNSGYSVFKSKTSGKLAILAELIMIDSYNVTHSLVPKKTNNGEIIDGAFDLVIHTEVTPDVTPINYKTVPKLQYYYLKNSQGYIDDYDPDNKSIPIPLFDDKGVLNKLFTSKPLSGIYVPTITDGNLKFEGTLGSTGKFNFPQSDTYHSHMQIHPEPIKGVSERTTYTKFSESKYHRVILDQIPNLSYFTDKLQAKFYQYQGNNTEEYQPWKESTLNSAYTYYVKNVTYEYSNAKRDQNFASRDLFKLVSEPTSATDKEIKDIQIEKFQYANVLSVRVATTEDYEKGTTLYEKKDDSYVQITSLPEAGVTYYVLTNETVLVSIGFDIIKENHPREIFYYPSEKSYVAASTSDLATYWDFTTYPRENSEPYGCPIMLYYREPNVTYRLANAQELLNFRTENIQLYYKADYVHITKDELSSVFTDKPIYVVVPIDAYVSQSNFVPSLQHNYIAGCENESNSLDANYPVGDPLVLYQVSDFIPTNPGGSDYKPYNDVILANIQIPNVCTANGLDLPFRYDYTLVPCMNYGRLDYLAISNTVEFSKLHAFDQSDYNTWKYRIDGEQLRLTFGAEVYDTYEEEKVSGLFLEFYDLWGFAGSLEINNKKSYNGLFTKVIPLNTTNVLSKKKLIGNNTLVESFKRNININYNTDDNKFVFNDTSIVFKDDLTGWSGIDDDNNDCGTLYSNILYTVKTYLKHPQNGEVVYIPKREFFLYTLPIFNDYYYNVSDFSTISSPSLDLVLTYKLQDSSSQLIYNQKGDSEKNTIVKGYYKKDLDLLNQYNSGYISNNVTSINTVKYVNYTGQTNLYLEVGLKQEYQEFGLRYSPDINERFSCTINLVGNEDKQIYSVISNNSNDPTSDSRVLLNYYHGDNIPIDMSVNTLKFGTTNDSKLELTNLRSHNFLNPKDNVSIPIPVNYNFVVGYPINVTNISDTEIQALTICALCHQDDSGEYNYSDFGIYEQGDRYLSETMWYNGGTHEIERFGVCKMVAPDEQFMGNQCQSVDFVESEATFIKNEGKLNTGEPLKRMRDYIGKLTFCQPHAHCLKDTEGVNIHGDASSPNHAIAPNHSLGGEAWGLLPWWYLYQNPRYNSCLHTKNTLNSYSEFISTLDYNVLNQVKMFDKEWEGGNDDKNQFLSGYVSQAREYTGFTSLDLEKYNSRLLQTMKKVYAYNPDYDSLKMKAGDASVMDNKINFISHIVSEDAKIKFETNETLNDFIYFGTIKVSDYINLMWQHSASEEALRVKVYSDRDLKKPQDQITFVENLGYCGGEDPYLVSTLTYNTPAPADLQSEWALKVSNPVVVRKENRECVIINGTPNKKTLYGFDEASQKLVELDVSNYEIEQTGALILKDSVVLGNVVGAVNITSDNFTKLFHNLSADHSFIINSGELAGKTVNLNISWSNPTTYLKHHNNKIYFLNATKSAYPSINLTVTAEIVNDDPTVTYLDAVVSLKGKVVGKMLNYDNVRSKSANSSYDCYIGVEDQSVEQLQGLVKNYSNSGNTSILLNVPSCVWGNPNSDSGQYTTSTSVCWVDTDSKSHKVSVNNGDHLLGSSLNNKYTISVNVSGQQGLGLYEIEINQVLLMCDKRQKLNIFESDVVQSKKTVGYASYSKDTHRYTVSEKYKTARLQGTSITINDLEYDYKGDHRLFIKQSCIFEYDDYLRNRLYYRSTNGHSNTQQYTYGERSDDGVMNGCVVRKNADVVYLNTLYFYTGPCFTKDNL